MSGVMEKEGWRMLPRLPCGYLAAGPFYETQSEKAEETGRVEVGGDRCGSSDLDSFAPGVVLCPQALWSEVQ